MEERALLKELGKRKASPSPTDNRLRVSFWQEYDRAQAKGRPMNMSMVYGGICSREYWEQCYLKFAEKVAWLMTPPASYSIAMEEALIYAIEQMRDILEMPNEDPVTGKLNFKLMELKAKIYESVHIRVKGAPVQRVENKTMSLNVNTSEKQVAEAMMLNSMDEIRHRMKQLEKREKAALNLPAEKPTIVIDQED